jgi:hypothetical protein
MPHVPMLRYLLVLSLVLLLSASAVTVTATELRGSIMKEKSGQPLGGPCLHSWRGRHLALRPVGHAGRIGRAL